jgi:hypothetical protein
MTNGLSAANTHEIISSQPASPANGNGNGANATAPDLLAEMRDMTLRIEQACAAWEAREQEGEGRQARLLAQLQQLPDQIARGLSEAMKQQHHLIMNDVHLALDNLVSELRAPAPSDHED